MIVATDSFALIAHAYPSYVTATALSLLIFYWAFAGVAKLFGSLTAHATCGLAIFGGILAFVTIRNEIAIPNWRHFQEIRTAILAHADVGNFHFIGRRIPGPSFQEFSWRNVNVDVYLNLVAVNVADDLLLKRKISSAQRSNMFFSFSDSEPRPESVMVILE